MEILLDNYYDYINILAFSLLSKYENRRYIDIKTLEKFRDTLYDETKEYLGYFCDEKRGPINIIYNKTHDLSSLAKFLEDYSAYFYREDDKIYIKDDLRHADLILLEEKVREEHHVPKELKRCAYLNDVLFDCLGIKSIASFLSKYLKVEEKLIELYSNLYTEYDNSKLRKDLNDWINIRNTAFIIFSMLTYDGYEAFTDITELSEDNDIEYGVYPIDVEKYYKSKYYDKNNLFSDIQIFCEDMFMFAIMGDQQDCLTRAKFKYDLDNLGTKLFSFDLEQDSSEEEIEFEEIDFDTEIDEEFLETMFDDFDTGFEDDYEEEIYDFTKVEDEEFLFNMKYVSNIDEFIQVFGSNDVLLNIKRKLLYLLEKSGYKLYDENNFKKQLEEVNKIDLSKSTIKDMKNNYYYLVDDVFNSETNKLTAPKLLIIKSYYQLSQDEGVVQAISEHRKDFRYGIFSDIILDQHRINKDNKKYIKKYGDYFRNNNDN